MKMFKIWNGDRSQKKFVVCEKASLELLKQKASEKFKSDAIDHKIVLEDDGTEIEDDEVLGEIDKTTVLMLLASSESWKPKDVHASLGPQTVVNTGCSTEFAQNNTDGPVNADVCTAGVNEEQSSVVNEPNRFLEASPNSSSSDVVEIHAGIMKAPLPTFSAEVQQHLNSNTVELVWNKMIGQVAEYYYERWPAIGDRSQYAIIGEKMFKRWPCIRQEVGAKPWSMFSKNLSQRIRHKRLAVKQKSQLVQADGQPSEKKRKIFKVCSVVANELDTASHVEALCSEFRKPRKNQNVQHIKMLLQATQGHREKILLEDENGSLKGLFKEYPCFRDGLYILFNFTVKFGAERLQEVSANMKRFMIAVEKLGKLDCENSDCGLNEILRFVEEKVKFDRGQKIAKEFSSIVELKEDIPDDEIKKNLICKEFDPPRLVVFHSEKNIKAMFVLADGEEIKVHGSSVHSGITQLLAVYYVFNLNYPRCFAMILAVLQTFVMGENYSKTKSKNQVETSKKYTFFVKELRPVFDSVEVPDNGENC